MTTGRCLCGTVTFEADGVGDELHVCHCSMCRRWNGGPAFAVQASGVRFEGGEHITTRASSEWAERGFCSQCGSGLFYRLKGQDQHFMSLGAFDDQSRFRLASEIYIDNKPPGYELAGEHPRLTEQEFLATIQPPTG